MHVGPTVAAGGETSVANGLWRAMPNWLTLSRVLLAMVFFAVLTAWRYPGSLAAGGRTDGWLLFAAGLFIVAGVTDVLDGYLARRWGAVSAFGRIMDPFADKLLVVGAFAYLAGSGFWLSTSTNGGVVRGGIGLHRAAWDGVQVSGVQAWMVAVILGRELLVTSIRGVLEGEGVSFPSGLSGKLKMFFQSVTIPTVLIVTAITPVLPDADGGRPWGRWLIDICVWVTIVVTVWSGGPYVVRGLAVLGQWRRSRRGGGDER